MFQKTFSRFAGAVRSALKIRFLGGYNPVFTPFGDNTYESDVVRSTIDTIARNAAKIKAKHVRRVNGKVQNMGGNIERLLSVRPNPKQNAYSFWYKVFTQLLLRSNAFIIIDRAGPLERYRIRGFYPVDCIRAEMLETENEYFIRFQMKEGHTYIVPYSDVIHLRRFFNADPDFGSGNEVPLLPTLELIQATNQGIINAIKSSAFVRGILKFTQNLNPSDRKKQTDDFIRDYFNPENGGGIAATDVKAEFTPLNADPKMIDAKQMGLIEQKVYKYFGVNEKIVNSSYNEDEWNAFYESVIEPTFAIQTSLEVTTKVFSDNEQNHGNEIVFEANRLQYASVKTKLDLMQMVDRGAMTPNEWREVMNMAPVEGGDEPIRRLDTATVNAAPVKKTPPKGGEEENDEDDDGDES
ncbi:phage portal protein [Paenibacillus sp. JDR-2]|uniref:phage portal protein n=1 Tax=Paenibacillus sp. (strain JDR-2) TaxID=324057 RepID=UPI00223E9572|nr:phage portal protein [Paenibacillus sp. JDR-2]